jgi:hypothetical protein
VLASLQGMVKSLDALLSRLDPAALHSNDAAALLDQAILIERRAVSLRTLVADRAASSTDFVKSGSRNAEEWLSTKTGSSYREAQATLETSEKLKGLPSLAEALRRGELSATKLGEVGRSATPENEVRLLDAARTENVRDLRKTCAAEKARSRSDEEEARRHARIHRERFHRSWADDEGAYRYEGKTTAAEGARWDAAIAAEAEKVFKAAYAEGRREPAGAYRSDAVGNLLAGGGAGVDTTVVIRVAAERLEGGEGICETTTGPVPVDVAIAAIFAKAYVKVLLKQGVDVTKVLHVGRRIPPEVKTAILERDGYRCVRPGCGNTSHLEIHHYRIDFAKGGPTEYWNLAPLCGFDHDLVTTGGHRLGGGPGNWTWIPPP